MADADPKAMNALLCNCTAIRQAARHLSRFYDAALAEVGLRGTQYTILRLLARNGRLGVAELAASVVMDRSTMGHNLRPLERAALVSIETDALDRRARMVSLTASGRQRVTAGEAVWARAQRQFETEFGRSRAKELRRMMAAVVATELPPD